MKNKMVLHDAPSEPSTSDASQKVFALTVAIIGSFITPFMVSSISIALPAIEKEFKPNAVLLSWIVTSYLLASAIALVPFGKLGDIFGRKRIFVGGILVYTTTSILIAASTSVTMLLCFRVLQGLGAAMIFATRLAILVSVFSPAERGRVLGINVAAVYSGLSTGPFLGGLLTQYFTWRSIFLFNIPLGLIVIFIVTFKLKGEWAEAKGEKFDWIGSFIYGAGLVMILYGVSLLPTLISVGLIMGGVFLLVLFVKWESRISFPVFPINLFRTNKVFSFSCLAALISYSATFAVTFLLSLYLQYIKGFTPQMAGFVLMAQPVVMAIISPFTGRLSDRVEPRIIASAGMALTAAGLFLLVFLTPMTSMTFVVVNLILLGFGFAFFSPPNMNAIMGSVEKKFYGIAAGSLGTMRILGQVFSMGIATMGFAVFMGRVQVIPKYYPGFMNAVKIEFLIFSMLCAGGIYLSLARGKLRMAPIKQP